MFNTICEYVMGFIYFFSDPLGATLKQVMAPEVPVGLVRLTS